jgi:uncharacterized membrane protein YhhN
MLSIRNLTVITSAACLALVGMLYFDLYQPAFAAKFVASTSFFGLAIKAGAMESTYGRLILLGLGFSWCGDMFLTGQSQLAFLAGLCAFLLGHVAYVSAFIRHGYRRAWIYATVVPVTVLAIAVFAWLEPHTPANLMIPVRAYIVVISLMVIFAYGTRGRGGSILIAIGATLFFLSDLSVAALRLVQTEYPTYVIGLPFYYAGQVCLALSVSHSRSH